MKTLSRDDLRRTRGGGTVPDENGSIVALVAATWPGPDSPFPPPPGAIALFAELNGLSVSEVVAILNGL
jgi:hypothetical protein